MTDPTIALKEYLINIGMYEDADFLKGGLQLISQMLMELEVEQETDAGKLERTPERRNYRNGCRPRTWETRVGEIAGKVTTTNGDPEPHIDVIFEYSGGRSPQLNGPLGDSVHAQRFKNAAIPDEVYTAG